MNDTKLKINDLLHRLQIEQLNPMQVAAIESFKENENTLLLSATGSGKTFAFLLPLVQYLDPSVSQTQALIIVPSRELALQIDAVFRKLASGFKVTCCYGGHKREIEENNLLQPPALLIGTPGRLADHIRRNNITTSSITTLVLDEFDKSLELGFHDEMEFIIASLPGVKKRMLTSATESVEIPAFLTLDSLVRLDFLDDSGKENGLELKWLRSADKDKLETLFRLMCVTGNRPNIVFCNHRESVERVSHFLKEKDIFNVFYHGALEQPEREAALAKFRNGTSNILVTTDLAARGLDIAHIRYIVHYHLPENEAAFTHRNGRTARMDASGTAIVILGPEENLPGYIIESTENVELPDTITLPEKPKWSTLYFGAGKKDKINKIDLVGFLTNKGQLKKDDIGLIEVKDFLSFVAVRKSKLNHTLHLIKDQKVKNKKVKMAVAK